MRAVFYARCSTDEQPNSLAVQREEAQRYAAAQGWTLAAEYVDDALSGADFATRAGLAALLAAATARAFDVLIVRAVDRLGRDMLRTATLAEHLRRHGVTIHCTATGGPLRLDSPEARLVLMVQGFAAETERAATQTRTRETARALARRGRVVGRLPYGYRAVETPTGKERRIDDTEASVVLEIFERVAEGESLYGITHDLNAIGISSPTPGAPWTERGMRTLVSRAAYLGRVTWGAVAHTYDDGTPVRTRRPPETWTTLERPEWRIVSDDLWTRARATLRRHVTATGSWRRGIAPRNLLTGIVRCAVCGGPWHASGQKNGRTNVPTYRCAWAAQRGPTVCSNKLHRPVAAVDAVVLDWIRDVVLAPAVVDRVLAEARALVAAAPATSSTAATARDELDRRIETLTREAARLADAIAARPESAALQTALATREARLRELRAERAALPPVAPAAPVDDEALRRQLDDLRRLFAQDTPGARRALELLLDGPLTARPVVTPDGKRRHHLAGKVIFKNPGNPSPAGPYTGRDPTGSHPVYGFPLSLIA